MCDDGDLSTRRSLLRLILLVLALLRPRSKVARPNARSRSTLRRPISTLDRPKSPLTRGLVLPLPWRESGDSVARTLSRSTGVDASGDVRNRRSEEFRASWDCSRGAALRSPCEGDNAPAGVLCATASSTSSRRTSRASLPKLKKEKKYYRRSVKAAI